MFVLTGQRAEGIWVQNSSGKAKEQYECVTVDHTDQVGQCAEIHNEELPKGEPVSHSVRIPNGSHSRNPISHLPLPGTSPLPKLFEEINLLIKSY